MKILRVNLPNHEYDIKIGHGILKDSGSLINEVFHGEKIAIVTDSNVSSLYGDVVTESLEKAGFKTCKIVV
ncbi:MAG: 3-dehydroquinate synthase, partial [Oscillospiraceae bacterium]